MNSQGSPHRVRTVANCYDLLDKFFPTCGMLDYTEGIYHDNPQTPYEEAQQNQIHYVLDEVQCRAGTRVLEVGCGNGTLLDEVRRRGAHGIGITISPEQVDLCRKRGLDVRLLSYRDLGEDLGRQFDAVVANGPIEHFVQAAEAAANKTDGIYTQMFRIFHRAIDPQSPNRRLINTTIHFIRRPDPRDLLKSPFAFPWGSDAFRFACLEKSFGGFYPDPGQFERCAQDSFRLTHVVDGTQDYFLTSEEWLRRIRKACRSAVGWKILGKSLPFIVRHPMQFAAMIFCMMVTESWNWQFRGPNPPTQLLRQTWEYCG